MPGGLVDDHDVGVVEEDLERQIFRQRGRRLRLRQLDADHVAFANVGVGLDLLVARVADVAVFDQPLDLRAREVGDLRGQEAIETLADVLRLRCEFRVAFTRNAACAALGRLPARPDEPAGSDTTA